MTPQEKKVVAFLIVFLFIGMSVSYYRKAQIAKPNQEWQRAHAALLQEFKIQQDSINQKEQYSAEPNQESKALPATVTKKMLTGKIDINLATAEELETLPRIGPAMALRIIEYRNQVGRYHTIQDLLNVKGIGPKTFEKIKPFITVN